MFCFDAEMQLIAAARFDVTVPFLGGLKKCHGNSFLLFSCGEEVVKHLTSTSTSWWKWGGTIFICQIQAIFILLLLVSKAEHRFGSFVQPDPTNLGEHLRPYNAKWTGESVGRVRSPSASRTHWLLCAQRRTKAHQSIHLFLQYLNKQITEINQCRNLQNLTKVCIGPPSPWQRVRPPISPGQYLRS